MNNRKPDIIPIVLKYNHMKTRFFLFFIVISLFVHAQNEVNYYNFSHVPKAIMANPAYNLETKWHVGIPILNNSIDLGSSGISMYDLFGNNSIPIEEKFRNSLFQMTDKDAFLINEKTEILSGGIALRNDRYLSFGVYQEFDFYSTFPKSIAELFYEGTSQLNKHYSIEGYGMQLDVLGVYHVGIQQKVSSNLRLGSRLKLYSGAFNIKTSNNKGYIFTDLGSDNLYLHGISTVDSSIQSSGLVAEDESILTPGKAIQRVFLSGNKGLGFDFGMIYKVSDNLKISASLTDLGLIYNYNDVTNFEVLGSYQTEGISMEFDPDQPIDYWQNLEDELNESVDYKKTTSKYISWRPTQLTTAFSYSFGEKRLAACNYYGKPSSSMNSSGMGGLLRVQKRPESFLYGASVYYERNFNNILEARVSYTADKFSYTNLGVSASLQLWRVNLFAGVNDIFGLIDLGKANSASAQFGINVLLDDNRR